MTSPDDQMDAESPVSHAETSTPPDAEFEDHRPLIREVDRSMGTTYGYGGAAVLLAVVAVGGAGWWTVGIASPVTWLSVITVALVGLFVVRAIVRRRARRLYERVQAYCRANDLDVDKLRAHYRGEEFYDFFEALFELEARRKRLNGEDNAQDSGERAGGQENES